MREWRDEDLDAHAAMSADPEVQRRLEDVLDRVQSWRSMVFHTGHWCSEGTATGWSNGSRTAR